MAKNEPLRRRSRTRWLWIAYWVGLFAIMHLPLPRSGVPQIAGADKVFHFLAYFGLAWLGGWHHLSGAKRSRLLVLLFWAVVYVVYAGIDEWLQQFVGRTPELGDWIVDVVAVAAATVVLLLTRGGRTGLVR